MNGANPKAKPKFAPFAIGEDDAREWLKNPRAQSLAAMRYGFKHKWADFVQTMKELHPSVHIPPEDIVGAMALYNAGADMVLEEFIFLAMAEPNGVYQ